jgi:phage/plasmid-like protein (TIGR03299 family)
MTTTQRRMSASIAGSAVTATSAQDAAQQAGLDWHVSLAELEAISVSDNGVSRLQVPSTFGTVRTNKDGSQSVLGTVGTRYKVFQNGEMFSALDSLVDSGEARYANAGELRDGAQVWMLLELPREVKIADDPHAAYLLARTSHDGSCSLGVTPLVNRLFCSNQISGIFRKNCKYSLHHTTNARLNVEQMRSMLQVIYTGIETYELVADKLLNVQVSDNKVEDIFKKMWTLPSLVEKTPYFKLSTGERRTFNRVQDARNTAMNIYQYSSTQENIKGTAFGAFQAIVEYLDWNSHKSEATRAERVIAGKYDRLKSKALDLVTQEVA